MVDNQKKLFNKIVAELEESYSELKVKNLSFDAYVKSFFMFRGK